MTTRRRILSPPSLPVPPTTISSSSPIPGKSTGRRATRSQKRAAPPKAPTLSTCCPSNRGRRSPPCSTSGTYRQRIPGLCHPVRHGEAADPVQPPHRRKAGIRALNLDEGDELIAVCRTDGEQDVILVTHNGMAIRFQEQDVRCMGRDAVASGASA